MSKVNESGWIGLYEEKSLIGEGGNAKVFLVEKDGKEFALKELQKKKSIEKKGRFLSEIKIMMDNQSDIEGILPVLDFSENGLWYTMPRATPVWEYFYSNDISIVDRIELIIQLSGTLVRLHSKGISHRDIKPDNVYFYNSRLYLGDFGLMTYPNIPEHFTKSNKGLGAVFTIAPEMKRNPKDADGKKADVFSLAKTLWMLLSGYERGFDGVYSFKDENHGLRFMKKLRDIHLVELEELLESATNNCPDSRPSMEIFEKKLSEFLIILSDKERSQISNWRFIKKYMFGQVSPTTTRWTNLDSLVEILNLIVVLPVYNHMIFSSGGGLDFAKAERAAEEGCLYVYDRNFGCCYVVKPKSLVYEMFDQEEWNYFMLELEALTPILDSKKNTFEYLVEDFPGQYVSAENVQYGVYDYEGGKPLPEGYKFVKRLISGKIIFVMKTGPYNRIPSVYDGRHGLCSSDKFRKYTESLILCLEEFKKNNPTVAIEDCLRCSCFENNPFDAPSSNGLDKDKSSAPVSLSDEFIHCNCINWRFDDCLFESEKEGRLKFKFKFSENSYCFGCKHREFYLCPDGCIRSIDKINNFDIFFMFDRDEAIGCCDALNKRVVEILGDVRYSSFWSFDIEAEKFINPEHLFSREEIKFLMKNADDRFDNQLVIDENGYAKIIRDCWGSTYPVSHGVWCSGNCYVGKYSDLSDLDICYASSLHSWLVYLKTGKPIRADYCDCEDTGKIIGQIKKYY